MTLASRALATGSVAAALALTLAPAARADLTKDQCVDANGKAQDLRRAGKLSAARQQLVACSSAACPTMVRSDCTERLNDLDGAQPTMIFDVKDAAGRDVIDVHVTVDGAPLADHLDGTPIKVDPGAHAFAFEVKGAAPVTVKLLVKEGERRREEKVVLAAGAAPAAGAPPAAVPAPAPGPPPDSTPPPPAASDSSGGMGTQKILGIVAGSAGVVGLGLGAVFGVLTTSAWSKAKSDCGGSTTACTNVSGGASDRSTAYSDATISDIGFVAGGVLLATGAVLFLTGGSKEGEQAGAASVFVAPTVGQGRAGVGVGGAF